MRKNFTPEQMLHQNHETIAPGCAQMNLCSLAFDRFPQVR